MNPKRKLRAFRLLKPNAEVRAIVCVKPSETLRAIHVLKPRANVRAIVCVKPIRKMRAKPKMKTKTDLRAIFGNRCEPGSRFRLDSKRKMRAIAELKTIK